MSGSFPKPFRVFGYLLIAARAFNLARLRAKEYDRLVAQGTLPRKKKVLP